MNEANTSGPEKYAKDVLDTHDYAKRSGTPEPSMSEIKTAITQILTYMSKKDRLSTIKLEAEYLKFKSNDEDFDKLLEQLKYLFPLLMKTKIKGSGLARRLSNRLEN